MTLDDFRDLLLTADPKTTKWEGSGTGSRTVWSLYRLRSMPGDNAGAEIVAMIQVDRFARMDNDPISDAITAALMSRPDEIAFEYQLDYEQETGLHHHIWDCEVV